MLTAQSRRRYPNNSVTSPITISGYTFLKDGLEFVYRGFSAFKSIENFRLGIEDTVLWSAFAESNVIEVFLYTPVKDWGTEAWDIPDIETIRSFLRQVPFYVNLCLLTDDDSSKIQPAIDIVNQLAVDKFPNLILRIGNEPLTNKTINCEALRSACEASGYLYTSGIYEDDTKFFGQFWVDHSSRDNEWPRKAKNLIDAYNGGGPNNPSEPALKIPCIENEPIRPDEDGYNENDFYAYAAICRSCGSGGTFHYNGGKFNTLPTDRDNPCKDAFLRGLNIFSSSSRLYRRIDEHGNTLRTYIFGNNMIRIRPVTLTAPESGWTSLDEFGICWSK